MELFDHGGLDLTRRDAQVLEYPHGDPVTLLQQRKQQVFCPNVVVPPLRGLRHRLYEHPARRLAHQLAW
jgi:hypothetical protein